MTDLCFWCLSNGGSVISGYDPCEDCRSKFMAGHALFEVSDSPVADGQPQISDGLFPTGRWLVIDRNKSHMIFNEGAVKTLNEVGYALVSKEAFTAIAGGRDEKEKSGEGKGG